MSSDFYDTETVSDRYAYTPFGVPAGREGTTSNPFTYVGGLGVMAESDGLYFMRARFYDPDAGRFLSKDPIEGRIEVPNTSNLYTYSVGNPVVKFDPSGKVTQVSSFLLGVLYGQGTSITKRLLLDSGESIGTLTNEDRQKADVILTVVGTALSVDTLLAAEPTGHVAAFESGKIAGEIISVGCFAIGDYFAPMVSPWLAQRIEDTGIPHWLRVLRYKMTPGENWREHKNVQYDPEEEIKKANRNAKEQSKSSALF